VSWADRVVVRADFTLEGVTEAEADDIVGAMVAAAEAEEPGTLVYAWFRHAEDPARWSVLEVYEDDAAHEAHLRGPIIKEAGKRLGPRIAEGGVGTRLLGVAAKGIA
jgi:quinol monooxygenase YgiN